MQFDISGQWFVVFDRPVDSNEFVLYEFDSSSCSVEVSHFRPQRGAEEMPQTELDETAIVSMRYAYDAAEGQLCLAPLGRADGAAGGSFNPQSFDPRFASALPLFGTYRFHLESDFLSLEAPEGATYRLRRDPAQELRLKDRLGIDLGDGLCVVGAKCGIDANSGGDQGVELVDETMED